MIFLIPECNARTNAQEADIHVDTFFLPADRIVAIGDGHGDVDALRSCLKVVLAALREILCCFFVFVEYFYLESLLYFVTPWRSPNSRCASLRWNSIICVLLCIDVQQLPM